MSDLDLQAVITTWVATALHDESYEQPVWYHVSFALTDRGYPKTGIFLSESEACEGMGPFWLNQYAEVTWPPSEATVRAAVREGLGQFRQARKPEVRL
jgi:hypothetical protein